MKLVNDTDRGCSRQKSDLRSVFVGPGRRRQGGASVLSIFSKMKLILKFIARAFVPAIQLTFSGANSGSVPGALLHARLPFSGIGGFDQRLHICPVKNGG